jgi:UDP-N-acetylmuramyl pentapeptide synthase
MGLLMDLLAAARPAIAAAATVYRSTLVRRTRLVAVTGSFGKTTTARALTVALGRRPHRRLPLNSPVWVAEAVLRIRPGDRHAVVEIGISGPGLMAPHARLLRPDVAVVTSIGSEHHRAFGSLEVTRREKAELVRALPPSGLAVLNGDDPNVLWMRGQTRARVRTFGFDPSNDIQAADVSLDWPRGTRFTVQVAGQRRPLRVRLLGRHQIYAVLAAVTVTIAEGFRLDEVIPRLEALPPTPGRLEPVPLQSGAYLLRDDFKGPLETIDAALDVLAEIPAPRRIVVLGEVDEPIGSEGPIYRRLGERFGALVSQAILLGHSRATRRYAIGARRAGLPAEMLLEAGHDIFRAIAALDNRLAPGDVVLVKGRDSQRLARVALALAGRQVRCDLRSCHARIGCDICPMLERGWRGLKVTT